MDFRIESLRKELESLRQVILDHEGDKDFISDLIEGETSLNETVDKIIVNIQYDKAMIESLDNVVKEIEKRREMFLRRVDYQRSTIHRIMNLFEKKKLEVASATVSVKSVPPSLVVYDAVIIPNSYWRNEPVLDKKKIKEAILNGVAVEGCTLSNGGETISIRC